MKCSATFFTQRKRAEIDYWSKSEGLLAYSAAAQPPHEEVAGYELKRGMSVINTRRNGVAC
jgi:hypothetical protein